MTVNQQGDVSLFQTSDGGDISVANGIVAMTGGLSTAVYLALFGGNEDDSGLKNDPRNWWGNLDETQPARRHRSETQHLIFSLPPTSANLLRIEDAAKRDLRFLLTEKIASSADVSASIPALGRLRLHIAVTADGVESLFTFTENWKAAYDA